MKKEKIKRKPKKIKHGKNKGKKYEKPLCLYDMKFEKLVDIALKTRPESVK